MPISNQTPLYIDGVSLVVNDLKTMVEYYQRAVGLSVHSNDGTEAVLGTDTAFFTLVQDKAARRSGQREAGLFHTAFLMPNRADLGRWIRSAIETRLPVTGASDHGVSEAVYLNDPEGNGIEIYIDKPVSAWDIKPDGKIGMVTESMDIEAVINSAAADPNWKGMPAGSYVGHVHLQTGTLEKAESFYAKALGFEVTTYYPGAVFYGSGGYHHHLASNIWNSRGAGPRQGNMTGLSEVRIASQTPADLAAAHAKVLAAGVEVQGSSAGFSVIDPNNTRFVLA